MKILVADDEEPICSMVKDILQKGNHEVLLAYNGEDALAKAIETHPDLIISDTFMPGGMDGPEWIAKYMQQNGTPQPKIILMSGTEPHEVLAKYPAAEKYVFLGKPFRYLKFLQAISEACK